MTPRRSQSMNMRQHRRAQTRKERESESVEKELRELEIILDHYGAECNCCGQVQKRFLTLDGINDDGYLHRRRWQERFKLYRQIIKDGFPDDIQILCFNCKVGRQKNGGMCPHKACRRALPQAEPEGRKRKQREPMNAETMTTGHPMWETMTTGHPIWDRFAESIATMLETQECDNTLTISRELLADMKIFDVIAPSNGCKTMGAFVIAKFC